MRIKNPYLLPDVTEPVFYKIWLKPDLKKFVFSGTEVVHLKVNRKTNSITLHAVKLKIKSAVVSAWKTKDGALIKSSKARVTSNDRFEIITLKFGFTLKPEYYVTLKLEFTGILNDNMHGFYRTEYRLGNKEYFGAATQFESTDARRCFPCWDEPSRKAQFRIFLKVPEEFTAVSNMPVEKEILHKNGYKTLSFETSPVMSTYLVCLVVAHLKYIEDMNTDGVPLRLYALPGKEKHGEFAMDCDKSSLKFYGNIFGIPYKKIAPKKDMIALPDFASGAMENLGAVTYRETAALIDPKNHTVAAERRVAEVVMHENAHMWFGDLVTMSWWNGLWLNEGFATFMSYCAMHDKFPNWDVWMQYVAGPFLSALHVDALQNTHPIEIEVKNPYEIREIFDEVTYSKGSVVNRMLEKYLGEKYWEGLRAYLKKYSFKNADTKHLWEELEKASGKPVKDIMARYTRQPGYPVVSVSISEKGRKLYKVTLTQHRFLSDGSKDPNNLKWNIPLAILYPEACGKILLENLDKGNKNIFLPGASSWVKLNPGQSGFYRVAYSDELWDALVEAVKRGELSNLDCIGLLDDSMALAKAGYMKTSQALDMMAAEAHDKEMDYGSWSVLISNLNAIDHIADDESKEVLSEFAREILKPVFRKLGWNKLPDEKFTDTFLRSAVLRCLGRFGDLDVVTEARKRFIDIKAKIDNVDPDLKQVIYSLVTSYGNWNEYNALLELYDATDDAREKEYIQSAMGGFRDEDMVKKAIEFSLSDRVRKQDWFRIMTALGNNPKARKIAWNFLKENWDDFRKKYEGNLTLLGRTLEGVTNGFVDEENLADIKKFFKAHPLKEAKRTMKQVIETIETNIKWRKHSLPEIKSWLSNKK